MLMFAQTALIYASSKSRKDIVEILLQAGADKDVKSLVSFRDIVVVDWKKYL